MALSIHENLEMYKGKGTNLRVLSGPSGRALVADEKMLGAEDG